MAIVNLITEMVGLFHAYDGVGGRSVRNEVNACFEEIWDFTKSAADSMATDVIAATYFAYIDRDAEIIAAWLLPSGNATANGSNFGTYVLNKHDGAGGSPTVVGSVDSSATNFATGVPRALTLTAANVGITAGQVLSFQQTKAASGVILPAAKMLVIGRRK
ncbi:MAG TPA: hypothetical protein VFU97_24495 [Xanthobacteraceae bacterium]|nr:hypothetical protein [Xanthobacteraceae bacterium]